MRYLSRIDVMKSASLKQAVQDSGVTSPLFGCMKQPVLSANHRRSTRLIMPVGAGPSGFWIDATGRQGLELAI